MPDDEYWAARFPALFGEGYVGYADCRISGTTEPAPDHLVARLHLVAVTPDGAVVVCRTDRGWRCLPGGTREPGEPLADLARRELIEEAGAELAGEPRPFLAHVADSGRDRPYRAHLPHPRAYWSYAVAPVRLVGAPGNPPDGEAIVEVLALAPDAAAGYIAVADPLHADVVRLADAMGLVDGW